MLTAKPAVVVRSGEEAPSQTAKTTHKHLSPFQVEKFRFLFNSFFDIEKNNLIEADDIEAFIEKLRSYAGWEKGGKKHDYLRDIEKTFFECIKDQLKAEYQAEEGSPEDAMISWEEAFKKHSNCDTSKMNLDQWLNMWGRLCYKSAGIADFPIWVQLLPDIFFQVMDRDQDGVASLDEVTNFYEHFVGIEDKEKLDKISKEGYRVLTADGDYVLTKEHYFFCFANFLLGKSIYGPGKYIFGVFDNRELEETYKVIYTDAAMDDEWEHLTPAASFE